RARRTGPGGRPAYPWRGLSPRLQGERTPAPAPAQLPGHYQAVSRRRRRLARGPRGRPMRTGRTGARGAGQVQRLHRKAAARNIPPRETGVAGPAAEPGLLAGSRAFERGTTAPATGATGHARPGIAAGGSHFIHRLADAAAPEKARVEAKRLGKV